MSESPLEYGWWPQATDLKVASYRIRCHRVIEGLRQAGLNCGTWQPGQKPPRVLILFKRYDEYSQKTASELRKRHGSRILFDICDNHFHTDRCTLSFERRVDALRRTISMSDHVIASSKYLASVIQERTDSGRNISVVGDAVENVNTSVGKRPGGLVATWRLNKVQRELSKVGVEKRRRIVWFGNHGSPNVSGGLSDLETIREHLELADSKSPLHLTVVSNNRRKYNQIFDRWQISTSYLEWNKQTFSAALALHNVCVIPIQRNPFTLAKTNNRVATALIHGLRVIADPIPSYLELSPFITLGCWNAGLENELSGREDPDQRIDAGRAWCVEHYSIESICRDWISILSSVSEPFEYSTEA